MRMCGSTRVLVRVGMSSHDVEPQVSGLIARVFCFVCVYVCFFLWNYIDMRECVCVCVCTGVRSVCVMCLTAIVTCIM